MLASAPITRVIGANALKGLSKFVMIVLAAIAVNFIRTGIANINRRGITLPGPRICRQ